MKEKLQKIGKKKLIIISCAVVVLITATVLCCIFLPGKNQLKSIENSVDENFSTLAQTQQQTLSQVENALADYAKEQDGDTTVFTKGNESVRVKADENGNVTYISYKNSLADDVQVKIKKFNESMIQIGDDEQDVLKLFQNDAYVYYLKTVNENEQHLDIYYYGWTGSEAGVELVFMDGKLSFYTIHSDQYAAKSDAPDIKDIQ